MRRGRWVVVEQLLEAMMEGEGYTPGDPGARTTTASVGRPEGGEHARFAINALYVAERIRDCSRAKSARHAIREGLV